MSHSIDDGESSNLLLDINLKPQYNATSNKLIGEIELPTTYSSIPNVDLEANGNGNGNGTSNNNKKSISLLWKCISVVIIVICIYGLYYHTISITTINNNNINNNSDGDRNYDYVDDDANSNSISKSPIEHVHLTKKEIGLSGLEGININRLNLKKTSSKIGKSIYHEYMVFVDDNEKQPLATSTLESNVEEQGWTYISVRSSMKATIDKDMKENEINHQQEQETEMEDLYISEWLQSRIGMGFLEGYTTCHEIQDWYMNSYQAQFDGGDPNEEILRFLEENHDWMVIQADLHWRTSNYWLSIKGRLAQLHGMLAGFRKGCPGSDDSFGSNAYVEPLHGRMMMDFDGHRRWKGQEDKSDQSHLVYNYKSPKASISKDTIYLANMNKQPSLIHLLIHNANGDLYQIGDKFNIFADKPSKKTGRRKDRKRAANRKYMMRNHTQFAEDDDSKDDDGYRSRWGREMLETNVSNEGVDNNNTRISSSRRHVAAARQRKRQLLRLDDIGETTREGVDLRSEPYHKGDHCSAMIKIVANNSDLIFGHNTWDDYQNAFPRIFKTYEYPVMENMIPVGKHKVDFSSSPGLIASIDDFYIVKGTNGANLGVIETSIDVYNRTYLDYIKPESVLAWVRAVTANEQANTGHEWANKFSEFASGTYIDQWMVIDFNKFKKGVEPQDGLFTVLEEMPGKIHWEDMTQHLIEKSYWASYNNPYFKDIRDMTGQTALCIKNSFECYQTDPRGQIFHKLQANVQNIADFRVVMQYNHWQTDELSMKDSCRSIACRADLEVDLALWGPHGAVDAKVSSFSLSSSLYEENKIPVVFAKIGPTHDSQPPFCWDQFKDVTDLAGQDLQHNGHPACFTYDWVILPREHDVKK
jgi:hypothetical protein